ncbi:MAG TPA: [protein-PII] uridylyltransferase, partial [Acidimicrobiales bacterium]|nr:[protein-PII] uridylyltransferase [Acidimicrobiales bacterium]
MSSAPEPSGSPPRESPGGLRSLRAALLEDRSLKGTAWCEAYASAASQWAASLFATATGSPAGLVLVAVGGFGRGTLAPASDLDLLLVHDGIRGVAEVADALWYPIWDSGVGLDHSVRTLKEVRSAMDADVKVALGLLDARVVAGDEALGEKLRRQVLELWQARAQRWLPALAELTRARHERFGDLAFLLEPDLKEARGGLRDLEQLRSLAAVAPVLASALGDRTLEWAARTLCTARVELQRAGSTSNVLLLQDQDAVAAAAGMVDADALMTAMADAGRAIAWASDDGWRRVESWLAGPKGRGGGGDVALEPGVVLRDGEVTLAAGADPAVDASLALRVAAASAEQDRPMSRATLERLAARTLAPDGKWPPEVLQALLRLLGAGRAAIAAVEALDQKGVWLRYLPEWAPVRNRPQRNAYHRYTVDRHLLEAAANASALQSSVRRPDLLLLGALLHDIGKGRGGDHTAVGIEVASSIGERMGLPPADVDILAGMVRHHLLLPEAATRRDLDDPATAASVAAAVGDRDNLDLLAALAVADGLATGPAAWGPWKAGLVSRLVAQVAATLAGSPPPAADRAALSPAERALLASGSLSVSFEDGRLLVAAPDRGGLLAAVAGVLNLSGLDVRSAATISDPASSMALLRFSVSPTFDRLPDWARVEADIQAALDGRLDVDAALVEREARYSRYRRPRAASDPEVRVLFDATPGIPAPPAANTTASPAANTTASPPGATIVEVRAPDRGPVLHRVAAALSACGLTITCALVDTLG